MDLDKQLKAVCDDTFAYVTSNCDKYAKKHAKRLAEKLKETSPKLKKPKKGRTPGRYAKGWESKKPPRSPTGRSWNSRSALTVPTMYTVLAASAVIWRECARSSSTRSVRNKSFCID